MELGLGLPSSQRRLWPLDALAVVAHLLGIAEAIGQLLDVAAQLVGLVGPHNGHGGLHLFVVLASDPATDPFLQQGDNLWDHLVALLLQGEQSARGPDEDLGVSILDVLREFLLLDQNPDTVAIATGPEVGPRVLRDHFVAQQELIVALAMHESGATHSHILQQTQVAYLVLHTLLVEHRRALDVVGLDAPHIEGFLLQQRDHQIGHGSLEQGTGRQWPLCGLLDVLGSLGPHFTEVGVL